MNQSLWAGKVTQYHGWEWEREVLLPETLSPVVPQGESGAGETGKERPQQPYQEEASLNAGGALPVTLKSRGDSCRHPEGTNTEGDPALRSRGLGSGSTGPLFAIGLPSSKADRIAQATDACFKVLQSIISGPSPEPRRLPPNGQHVCLQELVSASRLVVPIGQRTSSAGPPQLET